MVVFGNRKYACLSCIRGHRSSSCEHRDRILLQVRKPGRKSQTEPQSRYALIARETSPAMSPSREADYRLVKVPEVAANGSENDLDLSGSVDVGDEDVVVTEKYVFVHVGDNLFRRELRPGYNHCSDSPKNGFGIGNVPNGTPHVPHQHHHQNGTAAVGQSPQGGSTSIVVSQSHSDHGVIPGDSHMPHGAGLSETHLDSLLMSTEAPPLVIGPMQYQHDSQNRQANILHELGISSEEATQIWPADVPPGEFSFATQCVLPGQCQCGDDCDCPDCYEHQRLKAYNRYAQGKHSA